MSGNVVAQGGQVLSPATAAVSRLVVPLGIWQKLHAFVQACPVEINGFGEIVREGDDLLVTDVLILNQTAGPGHVDNDPLVVAAHMTELIRQGRDSGALRLQWHSHVDFAAYFSTVDLDNIERYDSEWMVSLVLNKRGEYEARLDIFRPFRVVVPLVIDVRVPADPEVSQYACAEVADKVRIQGAFWTKKVNANKSSAHTAVAAEHTTVRSTE